MLAIPVPFVVSLLFGLVAVSLYLRHDQQVKSACQFLLLCALTTFVVGLRWSFELSLLQILQPVLAASIPVAAWHTFAQTAQSRHSRWHFAIPLLILICIFSQSWLLAPLDFILTIIYLAYGVALLRVAAKDSLLINVSLGNWESVNHAQKLAGWMLLFSAFIDGAISLDFAVNQGQFAAYILTIGHLVLLPVLSLAVVVADIHTTPTINHDEQQPKQQSERNQPTTDISPMLSRQQAQDIVDALDQNMRSKASYLDPELTLSKLSRKLGYPAKQISMAVNQIHQRNISKLINEYRIKHAQQALCTSQDTITQIFLNCGFQTKSNFNREFTRVSGMTPSQYRKKHRHSSAQ